MKWTNEQLKAITETGKDIIVSAGAGSGKTAVLTERVVEKIKNGTDIRRLLILTFTNMAAAEMRNRIMEKLKEANMTNELKQLSSAYITTFDAFTLSTLKKYHASLNLSKDISVMDQSIESLKLKEIINNLFEEKYSDSKFTNFIESFATKTDDSIKDVVLDLSSKLSILPNKSEYLDNYINTHYNDTYIDSIITTYISIIKYKILEIKDNYNELVKYVDDKYLTTYNLEPVFDSVSYDEIKKSLESIGSPRKNNSCDPLFEPYKKVISELLKELNNLLRFNDLNEIKESYLSTKDNVEVIIELIKEIDNRFLEYKNKYNLYTFNDIAILLIKLLKDNDSIKEELKNSFDEIMVDEYQDTSDIEEELLSLISNNNLYMVGDIKQSIYRFRHANPKIFKDKYDSIYKIDLLKNFRSRSEVLDNINLIFNLIMDNDIGDAEYKESHQMYYGNPRYDIEPKDNYNMEIYTYDKDLFDGYTTDEIEAFKVAYDIKSKIDNKYQILDNKVYRDCKYSDFSIIMDRGTSFDLYKKIFEYLGIPLVQIKNEKLTVSDDIIVLKNLLSLIIKVNLDNLDDEFKYYFVSIARSYLYSLNDEEIFDIVHNNTFKDTDIYKKCSSININELSNVDLINIVIDKFNMYERLITTNNIKESIIRLEYLMDLGKNLSNIGYTPIMFTEYLSDMISDGNIEYSLNNDESNSVKILNIHKSKGLEYNICYFTGLSKRINESDIKSKFLIGNNYNIIIPYINDGINETIEKDIFLFNENKESISEKIRLFYVALTRTKEKMIIIVPLDSNKPHYDTLVPKEIRLGYKRLSDILDSIYPVLTPYIKNIDKLDLSKDYENIKIKDYKNNIESSNTTINLIENSINYNVVSKDKYSKEVTKLITKEEYENMKFGTKLHYQFEIEDFKNTDNPYILKFLKHIDMNYINCYKEYEFIYNDTIGIIDLMLEYNDHIDIIDYKTNDISDEHYIEQLNGYKDYIKTITDKDINIYLYSIIQDKLERL